MKFQQLPYSCGPASIVNALRCFGVRRAEKTIRRACKTTQEGTNEEDIVRVLTDLGFHATKHEQGKYAKAWKWLYNKLKEGSPVILAVRNWSHYVTAIGLMGDRIIIADSDSDSKTENGFLVLNKRRLKKFWYHADQKLYSGLAVER